MYLFPISEIKHLMFVRDFPVPHSIQTGTGAHSWGAGVCIPGCKVAKIWSWLLASIYCWVFVFVVCWLVKWEQESPLFNDTASFEGVVSIIIN